MDWLLDNIQIVINWVLAGGFTLTSVITVLKTISQQKLNLNFDQLKTSINTEMTAVERIRRTAEEVVATKLRFDAEVNKVVTLMNEFRENPLLTENLFPKLITALDNMQAITSAITYKDEVIQRYAEDLKVLRVEVQKLKNKGA